MLIVIKCRLQSDSFIHVRLLVQQLTKRNFATELKQNETVTGLKRKANIKYINNQILE